MFVTSSTYIFRDVMLTASVLCEHEHAACYVVVVRH